MDFHHTNETDKYILEKKNNLDKNYHNLVSTYVDNTVNC